jgi:preprotein translocase subunit SecB
MNNCGTWTAGRDLPAPWPFPLRARHTAATRAANPSSRKFTGTDFMAEEGDVLTDLNPEPTGNGADTAPVAGIISQYIKDLSVENPKAPESFGWTDAPELDVQFNIAANPVSDEVHEVTLKISVNAKTAQGSAYIVDLAYCGLVGMRNMAEDQKHAFVFAEAPRFLFPFARRVIADATRDAGFAPLVLDPIDFNAVYVQQLQAQQQGQTFGTTPGEA